MSGAQFGPLWTELSPQLSQKSLDVLAKLGFERAAPVQATVIPLLCTNKDVAVEACTGSGKTLAFVLPLVEILLRAEADQAYKKHEENVPGPGAMLLVGGSDSTADVSRFSESGSRVLIGTPGRLNDVMTRSKVMVLKRVELLVLDEADRLLSMGFSVAITAIIGRLPKQRRTGLFSATQTEEVEELARAGLRNPVKVKVRDLKSGPKGGAGGGPGGKTPNQLRLLYAVVEQRDKVAQLLRFVELRGASQKVIVYFLTCACVDFFAEVLGAAPQTKGVALTALHGRMKQAARERALEAFAQGSAGVLLATDVAARGLDIPGVEWILQYDPPQDPDSFVHRVGRTARMGSSGSSLAFLLPSEETYVEFLRLRQVALERAPPLEGARPGPEVTAALRRRAEAEREVAEKSARAFVSFVRGYKEHQCHFIFRLKELPLGFLAASFGVLRMPKMREIKRRVDYEGFAPSAVEMDAVPYRDKAREKQRQKALREAALAAETVDKGEQERLEKERRREAEAAAAAAAAARPTAAKRRLAQRREEEEELDEDWKLLKKLKKGKISEHQYNVALGISDEDEDDDGGGRGKSGGRASSSGEDGDDSDDDGRGAQRDGGAANNAKGGGGSKKKDQGGNGAAGKKHFGGHKRGRGGSSGHSGGWKQGRGGRGQLGGRGGGRGGGGRR